MKLSRKQAIIGSILLGTLAAGGVGLKKHLSAKEKQELMKLQWLQDSKKLWDSSRWKDSIEFPGYMIGVISDRAEIDEGGNLKPSSKPIRFMDRI